MSADLSFVKELIHMTSFMKKNLSQISKTKKYCCLEFQSFNIGSFSYKIVLNWFDSKYMFKKGMEILSATSHYVKQFGF